jgi:hypothetical protein
VSRGPSAHPVAGSLWWVDPPFAHLMTQAEVDAWLARGRVAWVVRAIDHGHALRVGERLARSADALEGRP